MSLSYLPSLSSVTNRKDFPNESCTVLTSSLSAAERAGEPLAQYFLIVFIYFYVHYKRAREVGGVLGSHHRACRPVVKLNAGLSAARRSSGALGHFSSVSLFKEHLRGSDVCPQQNSFGFLCVSPGPLFQHGTQSYF